MTLVHTIEFSFSVALRRATDVILNREPPPTTDPDAYKRPALWCPEGGRLGPT